MTIKEKGERLITLINDMLNTRDYSTYKHLMVEFKRTSEEIQDNFDRRQVVIAAQRHAPNKVQELALSYGLSAEDIK